MWTRIPERKSPSSSTPESPTGSQLPRAKTMRCSRPSTRCSLKPGMTAPTTSSMRSTSRLRNPQADKHGCTWSAVSDDEESRMAMSPRKRARLSRGIQYVLLAVIVLVAALLADWATIQDVFFDPQILRAMWPDVILTALKNTVLYTACGFAFGLVLGLVLALMRLSRVGPYRWLATGFIEFFRGVPALVVFIAFGLGVPLAFQREVPGGTLGVATLALGMVGGAYMAETIRAGIQA